MRKIEEESEASKQKALTDLNLPTPLTRKLTRQSTQQEEVNGLRSKLHSLE
jgi:hypothetical protein